MSKYWVTIEAETPTDAEGVVELLEELGLEEKTRTVVKVDGATQIVLGTPEVPA